MNIVYATDIHGEVPVFERLLERGKRAGAVVIGGDVTPGFAPGNQRRFLERTLLPMLREFKAAPILFILGNDDHASNMKLVEAADREGVLKALHNRTVQVGGYFFSGYTPVNTAPLIVPDWLREEREIAKDLTAFSSPPRKTVCVFHAPPHGTKLDVVWSGRHVGSTAVRSFLLKTQPLLGLHGHIHESPEMGGMTDRLGKTAIINPGNGKIIAVDLETLRVRAA